MRFHTDEVETEVHARINIAQLKHTIPSESLAVCLFKIAALMDNRKREKLLLMARDDTNCEGPFKLGLDVPMDGLPVLLRSNLSVLVFFSP